jgi:pimeloyl-ACP methyl ester carboxylesterase
MQPTPFQLSFPEEIFRDLRERLRRTRWPDQAPGEEWQYGTSGAYLKDLTAYWQDAFDWRTQETRLNRFKHFRVPIANIDLHFIHEQGVGPRPMPLLLSHGWPGSIVEFHKIIPMLTNPAAFGGNPEDAFTVVAPSLPGYTLSYRPNQARFGAVEIAAVFARLMKDVLGYDRYVAQGGDWGAFITSRLAFDHPEQVHGIHINLLGVRRDLTLADTGTDEEKQFIKELQFFLKEETGYQAIMGTKPQTLAFALHDSPVGLASWIVEKFRAWSDCNGNIENVITRDELLTNITLYWATGAINSASWPYYARAHGPWPIPNGKRVDVPTAYAAFPREILRPPRSIAERFYNIQRWTEMPKGGHFAALEQPELLAQDIRLFFRQFR